MAETKNPHIGGSKDDMAIKTDKDGLHDTSVTKGIIVSDEASDAAGNGPGDLKPVGKGHSKKPKRPKRVKTKVQPD